MWSHRGGDGSLDINIDGLDKDYYYFDLVLLIRQQGQIYSKLIGNYSTEIKHINIDYIDQALVSIQIRELYRQSPIYEKSEAMYVVNDYLIRQGPTEQFDFNYIIQEKDHHLIISQGELQKVTLYLTVHQQMKDKIYLVLM